jgi:flagellin
MSLNSVNTNMGAMIALESLNKTNAGLATSQKRISTGYRVADSTDDGAAYAVAQSVRSTVGALTTANQQLGNVQGLLATTQSGLNDISNTMASMRDVLVSLSDANVSGNQRTQYVNQYKSLLANVQSFVQDAGYNGKTLIGNIAGSSGTFTKINTIRNEAGATYGLLTYSGSALYNAITFTAVWAMVGGTQAAAVAALLTTGPTGGTFIVQQNSVGGELNTIGSNVNYVNNQVTYNSNRIDALNTGLGSLVDADLAKESANLQALQIRQQLGTQALSLANQAPQTLLSLFK